jgi:xylulokinase
MPETADRDWYLGVDLGTGGLKVGAVGRDGQVRASAFRSIDTMLTPDGGNEQDVEHWFDALRSSIIEMLASSDVIAADCRGVGITGQWGSTVPVDAAGRPVGRCLLWSDHRGAPWSAKLTGGSVGVAGFDARKIVTWIRFAGGAPSKDGADPTGHVQFLRHRGAEIDTRTNFHLEPVDVIGAWLTGIVGATPASMVLSWVTDNRPDAPCAYHRELVRIAGREMHRLPPLRPTGSVLGPLLADRADELGLPHDLPVVGGVPDLHTAAIGTGGMAMFEGHLAISTSAWVSAPVPFKKTDVIHQMASIPGFMPGAYVIANNHETGGAALRWLRDRILGAHDGLGGGDLDYNAITAVAATAAPGSGGVIFTPWLKGERSPVEDPNLRASFLNLSTATTRADMIRSVLEGVAYNARWLLEATESFAKRPLDGLRLFGGGAVSDLWAQIHADVIGRPIVRLDDAIDVNARGAAWFAALSLGHVTVDELRAAPLPVTVFQPRPDAMAAYAPLYAEFVRLAKSQKGMFARLAEGPRAGGPLARRVGRARR